MCLNASSHPKFPMEVLGLTLYAALHVQLQCLYSNSYNTASAWPPHLARRDWNTNSAAGNCFGGRPPVTCHPENRLVFNNTGSDLSGIRGCWGRGPMGRGGALSFQVVFPSRRAEVCEDLLVGWWVGCVCFGLFWCVWCVCASFKWNSGPF